MIRFFPSIAKGVPEPNAKLASVLLLAFVMLLPFEALYNAPLIALGALGLLLVASRQVRLGSPENRFLCIVFLCLWLPMLAALPDAVNATESIRKTASFGIYFFAGIYVTAAYTRFRDLDTVLAGVAAICAFWCLDAGWQFLTGSDWFGIPYEDGDRLRGPFDKTGRIGYVLASLAPLYFEIVRRMARRWPWSPVLLAPFVFVVTLSGSRASWGALAVGSVGYLLFLIRWPDRPHRKSKWVAGAYVAMVLAATLVVLANPGHSARAWQAIEARLQPLPGLWSGDREQAEAALTYRLSIWETAVNMFSAHWLNGVGPRGFRYAYEGHSPEKDYFLTRVTQGKRTPRSPHLPVVEIMVETGMFGLLGYLALVTFLFARLRRLELESFRSAYPYALTLMVALFPFNGHLTFYGVFSSGLIWWMLCLNASAFVIGSSGGSRRQDPVIDGLVNR